MGIKKFIINLAPTPLVKLFAGPYVAGDSIALAISTARKFWEQRQVHSTIDLLGEELDDDDDPLELPPQSVTTSPVPGEEPGSLSETESGRTSFTPFSA